MNKEFYHSDTKITTLILLCAVVIFLGLSIIFQTQLVNRQVGIVNQTYLKANACIVSVQPNIRTADYVKSCYDLAEQETGTTVERYGDGR